MGHPLDPDPVLAAQRAHHPASQLTNLQRALPPPPPPEPFAVQAPSGTDFNQLRSMAGSRSWSIDTPRATLYPPSQREEAARSAQDVKFSHSALHRLKRTNWLWKKNPSSTEKSTRQAIGGGNDYSDGAENAHTTLKIYESFIQTSGRSDSPKHLPHNPTNKESQPDNHDMEVAATSSTIPV